MSRKKMPTWESISYEFANQVTTKNLFCIPTMIKNLKYLGFIGQISYNLTDDKIPFQMFKTFERIKLYLSINLFIYSTYCRNAISGSGNSGCQRFSHSSDR